MFNSLLHKQVDGVTMTSPFEPFFTKALLSYQGKN